MSLSVVCRLSSVVCHPPSVVHCLPSVVCTSCMDIRWVVFNCLNSNMGNVFTVLNDPESTIKSQQRTDTLHQQPSCKMIRCFRVFFPHTMLLKSCSDASTIAKKYRSLERIYKRRSSYAVRLLDLIKTGISIYAQCFV